MSMVDQSDRNLQFSQPKSVDLLEVEAAFITLTE